LVFGERLSAQAVGGLVLGFVGLILVVSSELGSHGTAPDLAAGIALALAAALGWGGGTIAVKELLARHPGIDLVGLATRQDVVVGLALLALSCGVEGTGSTNWASGELWLAVAFISVVGSAAATVAFFGALRWMSATSANAWLFLSPVVAVLLEIVLGHTPEPVTLVGMAITIAGVAIVSRQKSGSRSARAMSEERQVAAPAQVGRGGGSP